MRKLSLLILFSFLLVGSNNFIAFADTSLWTVEAEGQTVIQTENYSNSYNYEGGQIPVLNDGVRDYLTMTWSEWTEYQINVEQAGMYKLTACASSLGQIPVSVYINGAWVASGNINNTGSYTNYQNHILGEFRLAAGIHTLKIAAFSQTNTDYLVLEKVVIPLSPAGETTIEAEAYQSSFKSAGVPVPILSSGGAQYISFNNGNWVEYEINVQEAGQYTLAAEGAIGADGASSATIAAYIENVEECRGQVLNTGGWTTFENNRIGDIYLTKGSHTFKILNCDNGVHIDKFIITAVYRSIYVSADGDDTAYGDFEHPYKTLSRAKQEIAAINNSMTGEIIVNILPGYYKLSNKEEFGTEHSGKNGYNVIVRGSNPASPPVISGGTQITGWTPVTGGIWRAPVTGIAEIRNLYINGFAATRARSSYIYDYWNDYKIPGSSYQKDGLTVRTLDFPPSIEHPEELELVWNLEWSCQRTPVQDIIRNTDEIVMLMKQPYFDINSGTNATTIEKGRSFYMENAMELLDEPGEFYYNKTENQIYYYPYPEENLNTCETFVGDTEFMFSIKGESPQNKVSNIVFENLNIRYGAWNDVNQVGLIGVQADALVGINDMLTTIPAQFSVEKADHITIKKCNFSSLGSAAISMEDAVSNSKIVGNVIKDISGTGIIIGTRKHATMSSGMEKCSNIDVENNVLRRVATEYQGCAAISVYYENSINIVHNDIKEIPYTGISAGWGWGQQVDFGNINISYNRIDDVMCSLNDGGHIYTLGPMTNSVISNNYLSKTGAKNYGGIYTDSGSAYLQIHNNVIESSPVWWIVGMYQTHDMAAYNNYTDSSAVPEVARGVNNTVANTVVVTGGNWPSGAILIKNKAGVEPLYSALLSGIERPAWRNSIVKTTPRLRVPIGSVRVTVPVSGIAELQAEYYARSSFPSLESAPIYANNGRKYLSYNQNNWLEYDIDVVQAGRYRISGISAMGPYLGLPPVPVTIEVFKNGGALCIGQLQPSGNWNVYQTGVIGEVVLPAGNATLKFLNTNKGVHIDCFLLERIGD